MVREEEAKEGEGEDTSVDLMGRISQHDINLARRIPAGQTSYPCIMISPLLKDQAAPVCNRCSRGRCCLMEM